MLAGMEGMMWLLQKGGHGCVQAVRHALYTTCISCVAQQVLCPTADDVQHSAMINERPCMAWGRGGSGWR
jgi:hypothetical protein